LLKKLDKKVDNSKKNQTTILATQTQNSGKDMRTLVVNS